jgi:hypothetical protein
MNKMKRILFKNSKNLVIKENPECEGENIYTFSYSDNNITGDVFNLLSHISQNIVQVPSSVIENKEEYKVEKIHWDYKDLNGIQVFCGIGLFAITTNKDIAEKIISNKLFNENVQ